MGVGAMGGDDLKERYHGGDVLGFAARFGLDPESVLDFSSNINPYGPPPGVLETLRDNLHLVAPYPDRYCRSLRNALSERLGVPPEAILATNGAAEAFYLVCYALRPSRVMIPVPSFGGYQAAALASGAAVDPFPLPAASGFRHDPDGLRAALSQARREGRGPDLVFLANPNNPTGSLLEAEQLDRTLEACREAGAAVVLDEAFLDFSPDDQELTRVARAAGGPAGCGPAACGPGERPGAPLIVVRSMTKFYSLAGLRLGCLVGPPDLVRRLEARRDPWSVNALAQAAGAAALADRGFADQTRELTARAREALIQGLTGLGLRPLPGAANFLLVDLSPAGLDARRLQTLLGPLGILIRDCSSFDGLGPAWIRLAVRRPVENQRLLEAIGDII